MGVKTSKRSFWQRLLGRPQTGAPADGGCWLEEEGRLRIDLSRAPELASPYGAINIEDGRLQTRVLIVRDDEDGFHAFENKCAHGGRHLDPVEGTETICCCSMGKSVFDYEGQPVNRPDLDPIRVYPVAVQDGWLTVNLQ